jgi:chromosome partitioning protein
MVAPFLPGREKSDGDGEPDRRYDARVARVVAVANQKGGVAKTTTTHTLGIALSALGERILLVDLDPQACLTFSLGLDPDGMLVTLHDVLLGRNKAEEVLVDVAGLSLLPASIDLAGSELHLLTKTGREHGLDRAIRPLLDRFDTVLIDCPPSLGVLTVNGLTAADEVLVPLQCEALSHRGVAQLLDTVDDVREFTNPDLRVRGAIATMFDGRTRHAREVLDDVRTRFGLEVLEPPIPKSIRFAEAPARGLSILDHAPTSRGADAYRHIAATLHADRHVSSRPDPVQVSR